MCLIICAISSEASRESFKLGLSVCLEYLLMTLHRPPPADTGQPYGESGRHPAQLWHINRHIDLHVTANTKASTFTGALSKVLQLCDNYSNQKNVRVHFHHVFHSYGHDKALLTKTNAKGCCCKGHRISCVSLEYTWYKGCIVQYKYAITISTMIWADQLFYANVQKQT